MREDARRLWHARSSGVDPRQARPQQSVPMGLSERGRHRARVRPIIQQTTGRPPGVTRMAHARSHVCQSQPSSRSPRCSHQLGLTDLRFWPLGRVPSLMISVERDDHLDAWRVLHERQEETGAPLRGVWVNAGQAWCWAYACARQSYPRTTAPRPSWRRCWVQESGPLKTPAAGRYHP